MSAYDVEILRRPAMGVKEHGDCASGDSGCEVCRAINATASPHGALMNALATASARHVDAEAAFRNYHGRDSEELARLGREVNRAYQRKIDAAAALKAAK